jgi:ATP-dependent Clp protease ATP-binding subunit ClpX
VSSTGRGGWKTGTFQLPPGSAPEVVMCSFCGKTTDEVGGRLVRAGTTDIAICEECVRLCLEIFEEE